MTFVIAPGLNITVKLVAEPSYDQHPQLNIDPWRSTTSNLSMTRRRQARLKPSIATQAVSQKYDMAIYNRLNETCRATSGSDYYEHHKFHI
jgi:hypothetical protein